MRVVAYPAILTALSAAGLGGVQAQSDYYPHPFPEFEPEAPYYEERIYRRPILGRILDDFRMLGQELNRGFYELRPTLRGEYGYPEPRRHHHPAPRYGYGARTEAERRREEAERQRRRAGQRSSIEPRRELAAEPPPSDFAPLPKVEPPPRVYDEASRQPAARPEPKTPAPRKDDIVEGSNREQAPPRREFSEAEKRNFPLAKKTDRPGFVRSPYPPFELLDVRGLEPGGLAMEPESDRIFRIPAD